MPDQFIKQFQDFILGMSADRTDFFFVFEQFDKANLGINKG